MPIRLLVLDRKKPVVRMISSTSSGLAAASASGSGYLPKSTGVTMLTRSSVHWAERIVAARSSKAFWWLSAQRSLAVPGYSSANRSVTSRARPFGVLGRATTSRYRVTLADMDGVVLTDPDAARREAVTALLRHADAADDHPPLPEPQHHA